MVKLVDISVDDLIKYDVIFKRAEMLFGWNSGDAKKIVKDSQESILFCYHPMYMVFKLDKDGKIDFKSCVADDNGKVISITIDGYQVNVSGNSVYLIDENGRHQSLQLLRNQETPNFEVSANGLLTYMQYDSKKDVRLVIRYDQDVYSDNGRVYVDYLKNPFYISVESKPKLRDKGLVFLGKKDAYYRLDFDVWNNKWQYDLSTIGEYGIGAVMASDTISLHGGEKEFSRYYKQLLSIGSYISITSFPIGRAYKGRDIDLIIDNLGFNKSIPSFVGSVFNDRDNLTKEFQLVIDEYLKINPMNKVKK